MQINKNIDSYVKDMTFQRPLWNFLHPTRKFFEIYLSDSSFYKISFLEVFLCGM